MMSLPTFLPMVALMSILLLPSVNSLDHVKEQVQKAVDEKAAMQKQVEARPNTPTPPILAFGGSELTLSESPPTYKVQVQDQLFALMLRNYDSGEVDSMHNLRQVLTKEEQQYMALVPPQFEGLKEVIVDNQFEGLKEVKVDNQPAKGILLPIFETTLHDHLEDLEAKAIKFKDGDRKTMPSLEMVQLSVQIARGLQALHNHNLAHGNFTAPNVLLKRSESGLSAVLTRFNKAHAKEPKKNNMQLLSGEIKVFGSLLFRMFFNGRTKKKELPDPETMPLSLIFRSQHPFPFHPTADELVDELTAYERSLTTNWALWISLICVGAVLLLVGIIAAVIFVCRRQKKSTLKPQQRRAPRQTRRK